jgi:hypothetical protein
MNKKEDVDTARLCNVPAQRAAHVEPDNVSREQRSKGLGGM